MKCMVSYIHWYHEMNNGKWNRIAQRILKRLLNFSWIGNDCAGSVRLLRTGASAGTPYSYYINKVNTVQPSNVKWRILVHFISIPQNIVPLATLVFQVSPADSGFYSCVAGNILGESVSSAHLAISPAPGLRCLPLLVMASLCLVLASHSLSEPGLTRRQLRTSGLWRSEPCGLP